MSWDDVGKKRGSGDDTYLRIPEDGKVIVRILDEEPITIRQHKLGQEIDGERVFRTLTCGGDDCYVCQQAKNRFPPTDQWAANALIINDGTGKQPAESPVRVLIGGPQIWGQVKTLFETYGDVREFDVLITRTGKERDTKYTVSASPRSTKVNVRSVLKERAEEMHDLDALFPPIGQTEQKRIIEEASLDINYDPVAERMRTMTLEQAYKVKIPFGKKKDSTIRDVFVSDPGYLRWMATNVTSNVDVGAAARLVSEAQMTKGRDPAKGETKPEGKKPTPAKAAAPAPKTLVDKVRAHLSDEEPYASDVNAVAKLITRFGKGKKRIGEFAEADLKAMAKYLRVK